MKIRLFFLLVVGLSFSQCKDAADFYLGVPLQPRFDENPYKKGLNIFGILRIDSSFSHNNSFIEIQKIIPAVGSGDSIFIDTAQVYVENMDDQSNFNFILTNFEDTFDEVNYRPQNGFAPKAGEQFRIECSYLDLPVLTAYTQIPNKPQWDETSVSLHDHALNFNLAHDSTIFMFDVYLYSNGYVSGYSRLAPEKTGNTQVEITFPGERADSLVVFAYDYNLANYYLTSNTSLNFNKYRESFSEVENGFGVFGSLNKNVFRL
jgi:hypothetical protein